MTAEASPLPSAPSTREEDGIRGFTWSTARPAQHARYRLEWRLRTRPEQDVNQEEFK